MARHEVRYGAMRAHVVRGAAAVAVAALLGGGLAGCTGPRTVDDILASLEDDVEGLRTDRWSNGTPSIELDLRRVDGADAATLADAVDGLADGLAEVPEETDPWLVVVRLPVPGGDEDTTIRVWSDTDPEIRDAWVPAVVEAGCSSSAPEESHEQTGSAAESIAIRCAWLDRQQADALSDLTSLIDVLPRDRANFPVSMTAADRFTRVETWQVYGEDHLSLLRAVTEAVAADPQDEVSIVLGPRSAADQHEAYVGVLDESTDFAPTLQSIVDASPLVVDADMLGRDSLPSVEITTRTTPQD